MDPRFLVNDRPRETKCGMSLGTPLVTLAWRALRSEHERRAAETKEQEAKARQMVDLLAGVAEVLFSLRGAIGVIAETAGRTEHSNRNAQLAAVVERLERLLRDAGITIVAPVGQPYSDELMDFLENVAQLTDPEATSPLVSEVIAPAIVYQGGLVRMGKAVVTVPARPPAAPEGGPGRLDEQPAGAAIRD